MRLVENWKAVLRRAWSLSWSGHTGTGGGGQIDGLPYAQNGLFPDVQPYSISFVDWSSRRAGK